jgi:hypothetical protein
MGKIVKEKAPFYKWGFYLFLKVVGVIPNGIVLLVNEYHKWMEDIGEFLFNMWKKTQPYNSVKSLLINKLEDLNKLAQELDNSLRIISQHFNCF